MHQKNSRLASQPRARYRSRSRPPECRRSGCFPGPCHAITRSSLPVQSCHSVRPLCRAGSRVLLAPLGDVRLRRFEISTVPPPSFVRRRNTRQAAVCVPSIQLVFGAAQNGPSLRSRSGCFRTSSTPAHRPLAMQFSQGPGPHRHLCSLVVLQPHRHQWLCCLDYSRVP